MDGKRSILKSSQTYTDGKPSPLYHIEVLNVFLIATSSYQRVNVWPNISRLCRKV